MAYLGAGDLQAALQLSQQAGATPDLPAFREELVPSLRALVPCDSLGFNEIDLAHGTAQVISDAPVFDGIDRRFLELAHQHPLVPYQRRGDLRSRLISDFLSVQEFHRLELYEDIYRPLGIEDQLAFGVGGVGIVAINLARGRRTFTEAERQALELIRPHLAVAYRRVSERARVQLLMQSLERGLEERHSAVIQLDRHGRVLRATSEAWELLETYYGRSGQAEHSLPAQLQTWIQSPQTGASGRQLVVGSSRGRLLVRLSRCALVGAGLVILEEQRPAPPDVENLQALGLSRRQAQVLRLLACGKGSREIGRELQISTATVSKHLQHAYARLGVTGRSQALVRIYT